MKRFFKWLEIFRGGWDPAPPPPLHDFFEPAPAPPPPRSPRDQRQKAVYAWVLSTFGRENAAVVERVLRHFEEVVELAQAENLSDEELFAVIRHVYSKPKGDPKQEVGGIGTTLLAYCEARGISADDEEATEATRVLSIDPEYFRQRHNLKADAGIARRAPHEDVTLPGKTPRP